MELLRDIQDTLKLLTGFWQQIAPYIVDQQVVAHNGFGFDFHCLKQTLGYYNLAVPPYQGHCTYKIYRDNLASLCKKHSIPLNHHDALSDARACGELFKMHLNNNLNSNEIR